MSKNNPQRQRFPLAHTCHLQDYSPFISCWACAIKYYTNCKVKMTLIELIFFKFSACFNMKLLTGCHTGAYTGRWTCVRTACACTVQCPRSTPWACGRWSRWWWCFPASGTTRRRPYDQPGCAGTAGDGTWVGYRYGQNIALGKNVCKYALLMYGLIIGMGKT